MGILQIYEENRKKSNQNSSVERQGIIQKYEEYKKREDDIRQYNANEIVKAVNNYSNNYKILVSNVNKQNERGVINEYATDFNTYYNQSRKIIDDDKNYILNNIHNYSDLLGEDYVHNVLRSLSGVNSDLDDIGNQIAYITEYNQYYNKLALEKSNQSGTKISGVDYYNSEQKMINEYAGMTKSDIENKLIELKMEKHDIRAIMEGAANKEKYNNRIDEINKEMEKYTDALDTINTISFNDSDEYGYFKYANDYKEMIEKGANSENNLLNKAESEKGFSTIDVMLGKSKNDPINDDWIEYINDDEKNIYNYLLGKYGSEKAKEYAKNLEEMGNYRIAEKTQERDKEIAKNGTSTIPLAYVAGLTGNNESGTKIGQHIGRAFESGLDSYVANVGQSFSNDSRATLASEYLNYMNREEAGDIERFFIDATQNIANNAPSMILSAVPVIGQAVGTSSFFLNAYGSALKEAKDSGADSDQQIIYALASATMEVTTEKLLGGLAGLSNNPISSKVKNVLKNNVKNAILKIGAELGADMLSEATEEYIQAIMEPVLKNAILGEDNEISLVTDDAIYSALLGAFTAGTLNSVSTIASTKTYTDIGKNIKEQGTTEELIEYGMQLKGTEAYEIASKMKEGELKDTDYNIGELAAAIQTEISIKEEQIRKENIAENEKLRENGTLNSMDAENSVDTGKTDTLVGFSKNTDNETIVKLADGTTKKLSEVNIDEQTRGIYNLAATFDDYTANVLVENYNNSIDAATYANEILSYRKAGMDNVDVVERINNDPLANIIGREALTEAYKAGIYYQNELTGTNQIKAVRLISNVLGVKTETYTANDGQNGYIKDGKIYINTTSDNAALSVLAHEATHYMQNNAKAEYKAYKGLVVQYLQNNDIDGFNARVNKLTELYKKKKQNITEDEIIDEIVSNAASEFLFDEKVIKEIASKDKSVAGKIVDAITGLINKIKSRLKNYKSNTYEAKALRQNLEVLEKAKKLWIEGVAKFKENSKENSNSDTKYSIREDFFEEYDNWNHINPRIKFEIGTTSEILQEVGVKYGSIVIDSSKIIKIQRKHPEMTDDIIKSIPEILENPVIIMKSNTVEGRITLFGEIMSMNKPVLVALELSPNDRNSMKLEGIIKVASAYGKDNAQKLINSSEILWVNPNKNRTNNWLKGTRLQLPVAINQYGLIKKITDTDANVNTKFSLKETIEETKDLVAIHNLSEDKLQEILNIGGFPMPSIAITKSDISHEDFGDISVVMKKEAIDPQADSENRVYSGDAWTPMFPETEHKIKEREQKILASRLGMSESLFESNYVKSNINKSVQALMKATEAKELFVREYNIDVKPVLHMPEYTYNFMNSDIVNNYLKKDGVNFEALVHDDIVRNGYLEVIKERFKNTSMGEKWTNRINNELNKAKLDNTFYEELEEQYNKDILIARGEAEKVEDRYSRAEGLDNVIKENEDIYENFIREIVEPIFGEKYISTGAEAYYSDGRRKSFEQLHIPYTLENLVKTMKKQTEKGEAGGWFGGASTLKGASTERYNSINDIKNNKDKIRNISDEEIQDLLDDANIKLKQIDDEMIRGEYDMFDRMRMSDGINKIMAKAFSLDSFTKASVSRIFAREQIEISDNAFNMMLELREDLRKIPTKYFEAKPQRAVGFDEVAAVVVPSNISEELKVKLKKAGMNVLEYDRDNNESRKDVINNLDDVKFSLKETEDVKDIIRENIKLKETVETLKQELVLTHGEMPKKSEINGLAKKILRDNKSSYSQEILEKNLTEFFTYIKKKGGNVDDNIIRVAASIMKPVLRQSKTMDNTLYNQYSELRGYLKNKGISLSQIQKSEIELTYDSYNSFRKSMFGKINLTNKGVSLDSIWNELCEMYPEFFLEDATETEMIYEVVEALDTIQPQYFNQYEMNIDQAAIDTALQLFDDLSKVQSMQTLADRIEAKSEAKVEYYKQKYHDLNVRFREQINENRKTVKADYNAKLRIIKQEYYNKKMELNDSVLKAKARYYNEQRNKLEERNDKKKYRDNIFKNSKQLINWLNNPTEKGYVPDKLKHLLLNTLNQVDFISSRASESSENTRKWVDNMRRIATMLDSFSDGNDDIYYTIDPDFLPTVTEFIDSINKPAYDSKGMLLENTRKISDMGVGQLRQLDYILKSMKKTIIEANKLRSTEQYKTIQELGNSTMEHLDTKKDIRFDNIVNKILNIDMLDPSAYFEQFGDSGKAIFSALQDGNDKRILHIKEALEYTQDVLKDEKINIKDLIKKVHTVKLNGQDAKMTTAQIMNLYELSKRPQAKEHLVKGGIKITDFYDTSAKAGIIKKKVTDKHTYQLSEADITSLTDLLTEKEKNVADKLQKFLGENCSAWGNEVSQTLYEYDKFGDPNYWPIKSAEEFIASNDKNTQNSGISKIKNSGFTKKTVNKANNPIVLADIFQVYSTHIDEMATYGGMVIPIQDAMKWFNYKYVDEDGNVSVNKSIKSAISMKYGKDAGSYFIKLIKDLNGSSNAEGSFSDKLISNFKVASVAGNLRVAIQQPTAFMRAASEINPKYLVKAFKNNGEKGIVKAQKYCPIAQWKSWGFFDTNLGTTIQDVITGQNTLIGKIQEKTLWLAGKADDVTWGKLWNACEWEQRDIHKGASDEEIYEYTNKRLRELVDKTQVVDSTLNKSQIMRSTNAITKMEMSFMNEPVKTYNMLRSAIITGNRKTITRVSLVFFATSLVNAMAQSIMDAGRDDDETISFMEKYAEYIWENFIDNANPINMIPYVKDIGNLVQGYDIDRSDLTGLSNLIAGAEKIYKYITDEEYRNKNPLYKTAYTFVQGLSQLSGIPASDLLREFKTVANNITRITVGKNLIETQTPTFTDKYTRLYEAIIDGDNDTREFLYEWLKDNGKDSNDIATALKKYLKTDSNIIEAAYARSNGDMKKYYSIVNQYLKYGFSQQTLNAVTTNIINELATSQKTTSTSGTNTVTSIYSGSDIERVAAIGEYGSISDIVNDLFDVKVKNMTNKNDEEEMKKVIASIKSTVTSNIKDIYIKASEYERKKIKAALLTIKLNGISLYDENTIDKWIQ